MYVGPWQEYKLMKVIENLREENRRLRQETSGGLTHSVAPWNTDYDRGSSHHFQGMTAKSPEPHSEGLLSRRSSDVSLSRQRKQTKPSTKLSPNGLKFMTTVRDVDVFKEGCNETGDMLQGGRDEGAMPGSSGGGSNFGSGMPQRLFAKDSSGLQSDSSQGKCARLPEAEGQRAAHVHLGTGSVVGGSLSRALKGRSKESGKPAQPSAYEGVMEYQRVLQGHPLVQDLVRGAPPETKALAQRAGQPVMLERTPAKSHGKGNALSNYELQERIDRRLRLQMLYSGLDSDADNFISKFDTLTEVDTGVPKPQKPDQADIVLGGKRTEGHSLLPGVPWDSTALGYKFSLLPNGTEVGIHSTPDSFSAEKMAACPPQHHMSGASNSRVESLLPPLRHPYDVGAPIALPSVEIGNRGGNSEQVAPAFQTSFGTRETADARMPRGEQNEFFCEDGRVLNNIPTDHVDEDAVGALIDWAEQLNIDSVL